MLEFILIFTRFYVFSVINSPNICFAYQTT
nr:MAG TPA: hypothetical protein [Caudoviricetes sp.]